MVGWPFDCKWWHGEETRLRNHANKLPWQMRADLMLMLGRAEQCVMSIMREEVACRAAGKQSEKHRRLIAEFADTHTMLEQHVMMARLMV